MGYTIYSNANNGKRGKKMTARKQGIIAALMDARATLERDGVVYFDPIYINVCARLNYICLSTLGEEKVVE